MNPFLGHRNGASRPTPRYVRIRYTAEAVSDLERLRAFVAEHDPAAAKRINQRLLETLDALAEQPCTGRVVGGMAEPGVRQWVVREYVVRYLVWADEVVKLRLRHGRKNR